MHKAQYHVFIHNPAGLAGHFQYLYSYSFLERQHHFYLNILSTAFYAKKEQFFQEHPKLREVLKNSTKQDWDNLLYLSIFITAHMG